MNDLPHHGPERKTCMPCRKRKVKCDGRPPRCGPCSTAKRELDCVFPSIPESRDKRNALPKGKACLSCRGKKKKCDGFRPICSTCSRSRDGLPCIYDESNIPSHGDSEGDADENSPTQTPYASDRSNGSGQHVPTPISPRQLVIPSPPDSDGVGSTSPSVLSSSIPSSPHPLPLLRAVDERQMCYFRSLAFSNALRLGICFTPLKERFIREGDLSGHIVHPWFTWFMAVMGVHLHQESRHQWEQLKIQGTLTQILLKMVLKMQETDPPFNVLQVFYLMAMSCTYTHTLVPARRYLKKCKDMIRMGGFRLAEPTWIDASSRASPPTAIIDDRPPEYTEEKHELVSILVNLMYLQCMHCMLYDECHDMFVDLEVQLPDFARAYPEVFELSSIVLRARTVLLVRDVFLHINLLKKPDVSQKEWLADAVNLMSRLTVILQVLDNAVDRLNDTGRMSPRGSHEQRQMYLLVSSCKLFCITAQARIYMETSKLPIVPKGQTGVFRDLARESVQAFFLIYKTFDREDDLRHLDYFIIACWQHIRELYLALYPGDLDWYPLTEVSRQIILLEGTLRVTPAGRNVSVMHSMVNIVNGDRSPDEPNFLKEDDRLKYGL
ncbi:hypothetical protein BDM02DRAFT_3267070 [Thelephora ganbajun]|uniref:Uncharacterized protein n=1 Tax=Thelephora ganbajun TaxID=370292 RepID=A0ACB6ZPU1_THEGA|nr:hypothetical protein BDM02DRAFT_3267070 [Thelephora ganbajun]